MKLINSNEIGHSDEIEELMKGDLCKAFYLIEVDLICQSISGGLLKKRIITTTSLLISTIKSCQINFERSLRDKTAMFDPLNDTTLIMMGILTKYYLFLIYTNKKSIIKKC